MTHRPRTFVLLLLLLVVAASGCGGGGREGAPARGADEASVGDASGEQLSGRIVADGSSTGGGFSRFCRGETDLSNASRPIKDEEAEQCEENGVEYVEFQIVNDGLSVVVNNENDWADCLTTDELRRIWEPSSEIRNWSQVRDGFPDVPLVLAGPGTDSGTFDYFTEEIVGESGASRSDFTASEDDNVIVQAVSGNRGGLGYFGLSYLEENESRLRGVAVDGGDGCVEPSTETVQDGSYTPLGRPLFIYAKTSAFERREVQEFIRTMIDGNDEIARIALYVPLTEEQRRKAHDDLEAAIAEVAS